MNKKQIQEITKVLEGSDSSRQVEVIKGMRASGDPQLVSPMLDLLGRTEDNELIATIVQLLNDLRDEYAIEPLVKAVTERKGGIQFKYVVAACWQNRLDFSDYLDVFVEVLMNENYETAIEAFTVIEESLEDTTKEQLTNYHHAVKEAFINTEEQKRPLVKELLKSMEGYI
ncbi:MAG: hypothetical protein GVY19_12760 [Bacteroidetes bacterium]|nr:hypothetical protein [Bacteroidota bacterium]